MKHLVDFYPNEIPHGRKLGIVNFVSENHVKNKKVLNVGCGYGWFEYQILGRNPKKIVGLDLTPEDLEICRNFFEDDRASFVEGDSLNLPFKDSTFDTVVSWDVIEHVPKNTEDQYFKEMYRVLKNGGHFYLSTPLNHPVSNFFDPAWWLIGHRHYRRSQLVSFGENSGFKVMKVKKGGGMVEILYLLNLYIAKWVFRRRPFFEDWFNGLLDEMFEKGRIVSIFVLYKKVS